MSLIKHYEKIGSSDIIVLVYDVTDVESFKCIDPCMQDIKEKIKHENMPNLFILGNKIYLKQYCC